MYEIVKVLELSTKKNSLWSIVGRLVLAAMVYFLCQERNNRAFRKGSRNCNQIFQIIFDSIRLKISSLQIQSSNEMKQVFKKWKLNEDRDSYESI